MTREPCKPCPECEGNGDLICGFCCGTGEGRYWGTCGTCGGSGGVLCANCDGTGVMPLCECGDDLTDRDGPACELCELDPPIVVRIAE
jgi:hypothetical protein